MPPSPKVCSYSYSLKSLLLIILVELVERTLNQGSVLTATLLGLLYKIHSCSHVFPLSILFWKLTENYW